MLLLKFLGGGKLKSSPPVKPKLPIPFPVPTIRNSALTTSFIFLMDFYSTMPADRFRPSSFATYFQV